MWRIIACCCCYYYCWCLFVADGDAVDDNILFRYLLPPVLTNSTDHRQAARRGRAFLPRLCQLEKIKVVFALSSTQPKMGTRKHVLDKWRQAAISWPRYPPNVDRSIQTCLVKGFSPLQWYTFFECCWSNIYVWERKSNNLPCLIIP